MGRQQTRHSNTLIDTSLPPYTPNVCCCCVRGMEKLPGEDEGLVYATPGAVEYAEITEFQTAQSGDPYCGDDLTTVTTTVLEAGVDNVVSQFKSSHPIPSVPSKSIWVLSCFKVVYPVDALSRVE